jgi:hypothetical protein
MPAPLDMHNDADVIQAAYAASMAAMFDKLVDVWACDGEEKFRARAKRDIELRKQVRDDLLLMVE